MRGRARAAARIAHILLGIRRFCAKGHAGTSAAAMSAPAAASGMWVGWLMLAEEKAAASATRSSSRALMGGGSSRALSSPTTAFR